MALDAEPASAPETLIAALRRKVEQLNGTGGESLPNWRPGWQPGETVVIQEGPFAGQAAIFDACLSGNERVRVLRGRQLPVELPGAQLEQTKQPA